MQFSMFSVEMFFFFWFLFYFLLNSNLAYFCSLSCFCWLFAYSCAERNWITGIVYDFTEFFNINWFLLSFCFLCISQNFAINITIHWILGFFGVILFLFVCFFFLRANFHFQIVLLKAVAFHSLNLLNIAFCFDLWVEVLVHNILLRLLRDYVVLLSLFLISH